MSLPDRAYASVDRAYDGQYAAASNEHRVGGDLEISEGVEGIKQVKDAGYQEGNMLEGHEQLSGLILQARMKAVSTPDHNGHPAGQDITRVSNIEELDSQEAPPCGNSFLEGRSQPSKSNTLAAPDSSRVPSQEPHNEMMQEALRRSPTTTALFIAPLSTGKINYDPAELLLGPGKAAIAKGPDTSGQLVEDDARSEIQSILEQFDEKDLESITQESASSRAGLVPSLSQYPPRRSSLEPLGLGIHPQRNGLNDQAAKKQLSYFSDKPELQNLPNQHGTNGPSSPVSPVSLQKSLPPIPDPDPDLPFDFHRFLEQLRHRTADPVAGFLRSFLIEFGKKQWMVHEQVKIISDFLTFITSKMAQCEVWREVSDAEFDNAKEGMEKLVMNRLYSQTFSPAIPSPVPIPPPKGKTKAVEKQLGSGRRGQHQEDIERDDVLAQKVQIYGWVREEHLDIPPIGESGKRFLTLAQQELLKIKTYRAPRDKVICVLNCCKVIFGLLRNSKSADTSADSFVPLLIYVILQANPDHLVSNVQYIMRFRNQDKLGGEAGYYLSSLSGAIQFIENLDRTALTISDEEFERHVEAAVSAIAEQNKQEELKSQQDPPISGDSGLSKMDATPRTSMEGDLSAGRKSAAEAIDGTDEKAAVGGLLRTIQRPLSSIGRIFSEEASWTQHTGNLRVRLVTAHPPETPRRLSPAVFQPPRSSNDLKSSGEQSQIHTPQYSAEDAAARQASAEVAEAHRIQRAEHNDVVETLASMFPDLDKDIIDDVVRMKEGRVGLAVEACLALSS